MSARIVSSFGRILLIAALVVWTGETWGSLAVAESSTAVVAEEKPTDAKPESYAKPAADAKPAPEAKPAEDAKPES